MSDKVLFPSVEDPLMIFLTKRAPAIPVAAAASRALYG